ncbi:MAG: Calx-beta domain-containing protein [Terriglobales bacterium]
MNSQPGDYVGGGVTQTFTTADGTFSVQNSKSTVAVSFNGSQFWDLNFGSPENKNFKKGQYVNAQRSEFRGPLNAGIDVSGDGRGCNTDTGQFLVSDFALAPDGTVARLAIDFEQHCEGAAPALYGSLRYNSKVSQISRLGVGGAYTLKGNAQTSDSVIPVALSIPSTNDVTVQYVTSDGTAKQGVDYVSSTGTLTFPAGMTSEVIDVPIIGDRVARGNKTFKITLQSPSQALIGASHASILIRDPNIKQTVLAMSSQPGDYIGLGQQYLITQSDAVFSPYTNANVVTISEQNGDYWETDFAGPSLSPLTPGEYLNAQRYPFQPSGVPGLSVNGDFRGCNTLTGNFDVLKAAYGGPTGVKAFAVNFEQHCEGAGPALFGWVRIHSLLEQMSVTEADIQGSSAVFTVTLNPSLAETVSVTFSTADGTAVAGVDYVSTTQTVSFSPGMTEQTVSVPLLTSGNSPKKTFYGQLSASNGAAVWVSQGSASF